MLQNQESTKFKQQNQATKPRINKIKQQNQVTKLRLLDLNFHRIHKRQKLHKKKVRNVLFYLYFTLASFMRILV